MAEDNSAEVKFGGDASGAQKAAQDAAKAVKEAVGGMKESLGALGETFEKVTGMFGKLAGVVAGGALFREAISETMALTREANGLARALGETTSHASVLAVALGDIGSSAEEYQGAFLHFARQLRNNSDELKAMGVNVDAFKAGQKTSNELFREAIQIVSGYKAGLDQMQAAMTVGGRSVESILKLQKLNNDVMAEAQEKAEALGLIVGERGAAAAKEYKLAMNDVGDVMMAIKKAVGDAVIPVLAHLGQWFSSIGPAAVVVIKGAIGGFMAMLNGIVLVVDLIVDALKLMFDVGTTGFSALGDIIEAVVQGRFYAIPGIVDQAAGKMRDAFKKRTDEMVEDARRAQERIVGLFAKDTGTAKGPKSGDRTFEGKDSGKDKSRMGEWEAILQDQKVAYQKEHDLREMSKQDEIAYWKQILATKSVSAQEGLAIRRKIAQAELEMLKKQRQEEKGLEEERIAQVKRLADIEIDIAREELRTKKELGMITEQEELRGLIDLENQKYQIALQALQDKVKLYEQDKVARQKALDEIAVLEKEHSKNVKKINDDILIDQKKEIGKWLEPITGAIEKSVTGMIQGTLTMKKAMSNIFQSILGEVVSMLAKMAARWITTEIVKTQATQAGAAARTAAESTSIGAGLVAQMAGAVKSIMNNAAQAFAGVWAALSGIPIVGPAMAAAEAPMALSTVAGMTGMLSARGGFDIPAGVNPLVQTHEKEMILPAKYADTIRQMADGGGAGGDTHVHLHAGAMLDPRGVRDFFKSNASVLAPALRTLGRNFTPVKPR